MHSGLIFGLVVAGYLIAPAAPLAEELDAEPTGVNRSQPVAVHAPPPAAVAVSPATDGVWTFGGSIRTRYDANFNDRPAASGRATTTGRLNFDTFSLTAKYDSSSFFGAAEYRFLGGAWPYTRSNGYDVKFGEINFPRYAYAGYKLDAQNSLIIGINQVPFGLVPYFSTSYYLNLSFTMGIEDTHYFGVKYSYVDPTFNAQAGFYPNAGGSWMGISRDSARYSSAIVQADSYVPNGSRNTEQNMFIGRVEKTVYKTDIASLALGASVWHSEIYNYDTGRTGTKQLEALHLSATYGQWLLKLVGVRQDISPRNLGRNDLITIGAFDSSFNLATRGYLVSADLAYKIPGGDTIFKEVTPYVSYSRYVKDKFYFKDSERLLIGSAFTLDKVPQLFIYSEFRLGRNDPYTGYGQFLNGLGSGGDNKWKGAFFTNIGYYF